MQPSAVEHNPKIVHFNAQNLADLFAFQTIDFTQRESTGSSLRQGREAVVIYFPEIVALDQLCRRCMPFIWRVIVIPMTLPRLGPFKKLAVLGTFIRFFTEGSLTHYAPKMIDDLVFQNPDEPGAFRSAPLKFFVSFECGEKSFLHGVFRGGIVAQSKNRILEKIIAVVVQPATRIGRFIGELTLWRVHTNANFMDQ